MGQQEYEEKLDDVMAYYKNIREALGGLAEIININFNEKDFYHQAAVDNLKALHDNVVEVLKASFTPREIRMRLREVEFDEKEAEKVFPL
ncbi:MAG: hypothetical protein JSV62_14895 [Promethearchaeota archaeon]|nr:MAG: hypothetical protein JSV62_14895 [Candidatus Lokiarchaeota archaeon]